MKYNLQLSTTQLHVARRAFLHYAEHGIPSWASVCTHLAQQIADAEAEQTRAYEARCVEHKLAARLVVCSKWRKMPGMLGLDGWRIAAIHGDDLFERLRPPMGRGVPFSVALVDLFEHACTKHATKVEP